MGTEALIMTVNSVDFSFLFFLSRAALTNSWEGLPVDSGPSLASS